MSSSSNGNGQDERQHYCRGCGRWLCGSTVPLGMLGTVRIQCTEDRCQRMNLIKIGEQPLPRPDRPGWISEMQRRRQRATTF